MFMSTAWGMVVACKYSCILTGTPTPHGGNCRRWVYTASRRPQRGWAAVLRGTAPNCSSGVHRKGWSSVRER